MGNEGSTLRTQDTTPPCTCTASRNPAALSAASASAERTPVLQYSTICLSCGSSASALPIRISFLGTSTEPGMRTISYSAGSRTSTRCTDLPASSQSRSSGAVIVEPTVAATASSETAPPKASEATNSVPGGVSPQTPHVAALG